MPFDHFNLLAGIYDLGGNFQVTESVLGMLSLNLSDLLLDLGGGTGRVSLALKDMVRESLVVDVSRGMLRHAVGKGLPTFQAPAESLPFSTGSIDRIIIVDAFHHFNDHQLVAIEVQRVLAPGGRILIIEPDIHKFLAKVIAVGEKVLFMHSHFLAGEDLAALFSSTNMSVEVCYDKFNMYALVKKVR
jgi:ubiquinone/menaquinone biosynthesis C-methylase UbiE